MILGRNVHLQEVCGRANIGGGQLTGRFFPSSLTVSEPEQVEDLQGPVLTHILCTVVVGDKSKLKQMGKHYFRRYICWEGITDNQIDEFSCFDQTPWEN